MMQTGYGLMSPMTRSSEPCRVVLLHTEEDEAKPEAYRARSNDEYHPPTPIDERGSIGCHLFDVKTMLPVTIYRRQLSDELLALFD
jgi:hypothetical protein